MKDKKKIAVASLVMSLLSLVPLVISPDSLTGMRAFTIVGIVLAVTSVIAGFIGKKEAKGLSIAGIIIGIISCLFLLLVLAGISTFENVGDCVDNGDETSTCTYLGEEMVVPNSYLREDQMKK